VNSGWKGQSTVDSSRYSQYDALSQHPVLKLVYTQTVVQDGKEKSNSKRGGFMNVFNPTIISYGEMNENLDYEVLIRDDTIYVQSRFTETQKIYSTKYQIDNNIYYINVLTGEKEQFNMRSKLSESNKLIDYLKLKKKFSNQNTHCTSQQYKARNQKHELEIEACKNEIIDPQAGLFNDFYLEGKLILKKRLKNRETNKELSLTLISADTLHDVVSIGQIINAHEKLVLSNQFLTMDSISYNRTIPDIYYKSVEDNNIVSLHRYKGNGKYLVIDFWGTWCKPCLASIPELRAFYEAHADKIDLLSMNYRDTDLSQVKDKIKETGMYWPQGIATQKVNKILNPMSHFPGILMFDDDIRLITRAHANTGLDMVKEIHNKQDGAPNTRPGASTKRLTR